MEFHPIANCFHLLDDEELEKLARDIRANGLRHPVVLFENKILDGRNRFRACQMAAIRPTTVEFKGSWDEAITFVTSENLNRRHLTSSQRAMAATRLASLKLGANQHSDAATPDLEGASIEAPSVVPQAEAARQLRVSRSAVQRARQVMERGAPELVEAVEKGEVSVAAAAKLTELPKEEQREIVAAGTEKVKEKASELRAKPTLRPEPVEDSALARTACFAFLGALADAARSMQVAISLFAKGSIELSDEEKDKVAQLVTRYRSGADWIEGLVSGEGLSDDALAEWLKE